MVTSSLTRQDVFNEAVAVVPMIHVPPGAKRALAVGDSALALAILALRYPEFTEVRILGSTSGVRADQRLRAVTGLDTLPVGWVADVIAVAQPSLDEPLLKQLRELSGPKTVLVFAVENPSLGRLRLETIRRLWPMIAPYREYLPEPSMFLMASDSPFRRYRKVPEFTRRLSDKYLPALFTFAKNEATALFPGR